MGDFSQFAFLQASKLTLASSYFASGLYQTASAKLYRTNFSVTKNFGIKKVLMQISAISDFILASRF